MAPSTFSNDDGSGSSSDEGSSDYDMDMTEEEAMAIWLERNEKIGERVRRREAAEALRRANSQQQQPLPLGGGRSSPPSSSADDDSDRSLHSSASRGGGGDINSGLQHAAAVTHSDAWNRAISRNVMGEYDPHNTDPAYQNAYHAYQRFVDVNQPGVADNYVASTPGLAALMEERSHLMARERYLNLQLNQVQHQMHTDPMISPSSSCYHGGNDARQSSFAAPASQSQGGGSIINNPPLRKSSSSPVEITKKEDDISSITKVSTPSYLMKSKENASETPYHTSAAASAQIREYQRLQQAHSQPKSEDSASKSTTSSTSEQPSYFYGFTYRTQGNSKEITCSYCRSRVYTAPLAVHMFCQSCAQISKLEVEDIETRWEGKMQELEDMDMGY